MAKWNSEAEAREEIKGLVAEYYNQFKKPEQEKPFEEETESLMHHVYMMRRK